MLEVKLLISDLDYDGVVDLVVPAVAKKLRTRKGLVGRLAWKQEELLRMAHKFLDKKNQDERDQLVADMAAQPDRREGLGAGREKGRDRPDLRYLREKNLKN